MRLLAVGDPHAQESNAEDTDNLFSFVKKIAIQHKVEQIHLFGDLYHDHGISKALVQEQLHRNLESLSRVAPVYLNNGNHDATSDMAHSCITVHSSIEQVHVILQPTSVSDFLGILPYTKHAKDFLAQVDRLKEQNPKLKIVFCHQDWQGAEYENGFFAPGGIDPKEIENRGLKAYSGHIHKSSLMGSVRLIGAPRWLTKSDAGQDRGVWLLEFSAEGAVLKETFFSAKNHCSVVRSVELSTGFATIPEFKANDKVWITGTDLTDEEVSRLKQLYKNPVIRHQKTRTELAPKAVSETLGVTNSLKALAASYFSQNPQIDRNLITEELKNRLGYDLA